MLQDLRAGALDSKYSLGLLKLHRLVRIRSVVQLDRLMTARRPNRSLSFLARETGSDGWRTVWLWSPTLAIACNRRWPTFVVTDRDWPEAANSNDPEQSCAA
ncbi:hypothetical protein ACO3_500003 [Thiomonas arsenitoxydans]|nr:hypothetical protein ACO3_500003 [Thiomonas arsenitoxydans]